MTHDEFFELAIDPDESRVQALTPAERDAIETHRKECLECAAREADFRKIVGAARELDRKAPPSVITPEVGQAIREMGRRSAAANRLKRRLRWGLLGALVLAAPFVIWAVRQGSTTPPAPPPHDAPVDPNITPGHGQLPGPRAQLDEGRRTLAEAMKTNDRDRARAALAYFKALETTEVAIEARLGAAHCLAFLGRGDEARVEIDAVLDDPHATMGQKDEASQILKTLPPR